MTLRRDKQKKLEKVSFEIRKCPKCKKGKTGKAVPGEGNPEAKIVFVGEAPGRTEAKTGRPFVGPSGQYLTSLLASIGIKREDVFITSPVKYFPGTRAPTQKEIEHGKVHLLKQLEIIRPKLIVLLGNVAARALLGKGVLVSQNHGKVIEKERAIYFCTFHPSAARRFSKIRDLIEGDFRKLKRLIEDRTYARFPELNGHKFRESALAKQECVSPEKS